MIKVKWDSKVCIHNGNCVKTLPKVFSVVDGKFVIDEKAASEAEIRKTVSQCPSKALSIE